MSPRQSRLPHQVFTDRRLKESDLRVLGVLGRSTGADGWCRRSQGEIAKQIGINRSTVVRALQRLRAYGYVVLQDIFDEGGGRRASLIQVRDPGLQAALFEGEDGAPVHQGGDARMHQAPDAPGASGPDAAGASTKNDDSERDSSLRSEFVAPRRSRTTKNRAPGQRELIPAIAVAGGALPRRGNGAGRPGRGTRISEDWRPSDVDRAFAAAKGFSAAEIEVTAELFVAHYVAKPGRDGRSADWAASWRKWVLGALQRREEANGRTDGGIGAGSGLAADRHGQGPKAERLLAAFARAAGRPPGVDTG